VLTSNDGSADIDSEPNFSRQAEVSPAMARLTA